MDKRIGQQNSFFNPIIFNPYQSFNSFSFLGYIELLHLYTLEILIWYKVYLPFLLIILCP